MKKLKGLAVLFINLCLLSACHPTAGIKTSNSMDDIEYESVLYEPGTLGVNQEEAAWEKLEERLEHAIHEMLSADVVSVTLTEGHVAVQIQAGNHVLISEEQKDNIKDLVGRSVNGISETEIELDFES